MYATDDCSRQLARSRPKADIAVTYTQQPTKLRPTVTRFIDGISAFSLVFSTRLGVGSSSALSRYLGPAPNVEGVFG
jgi:hypothetical protein